VIGNVTTVDPDGVPQSSPIWFLWMDGELLIYSWKWAPRNDNVAARPSVSFNLNTDAEGGDVVTMEGTARIDPDAPPAHEQPSFSPRTAEHRWNDWTPDWPSGSTGRDPHHADPLAPGLRLSLGMVVRALTATAVGWRPPFDRGSHLSRRSGRLALSVGCARRPCPVRTGPERARAPRSA
jgi:PPOX class probable F420-dependent enzyme